MTHRSLKSWLKLLPKDPNPSFSFVLTHRFPMRGSAKFF
jgi:hypothetical protein